MIGLFKENQLYIELRPKCPNCKKEFMLDLKRFLPGRAHSCHGCGTVTTYDPDLADKVQKQIQEMEASILEVQNSITSSKGR